MRKRTILYLVILIPFLQVNVSNAQDLEKKFPALNGNPKDIRREEPREPSRSLGPLPKLDQSKSQDPEYVAEKWWRHYRSYSSKEEAIIDLKREKIRWEKRCKLDPSSCGPVWKPMTPGDPDYVEDYFVMPPNEILVDCNYTKGYSYPDRCFDEEGHRIFDSETDGQEILDEIVIKQKWKLGKYNKMPKEKPKPKFHISETFDVDD